MGIAEEYREDVEKLERRVNARIGRRAVQIRAAMDNVLPFIGLLVGFIVIFGLLLNPGPAVARYVKYANYAVLAFFILRLGVEYRLKSSETSAQTFLENHWLDVAMVIPAFSVLEEVELAGMLEETALGTVSVRGTSMAAHLTKISRVLKRSVGL